MLDRVSELLTELVRTPSVNPGFALNGEPAGAEAAIVELLETHCRPRLGRPSLHVGEIHGGLGPSLYSPSCRMSLELRTLPEEDPEALLRRLRQLVEDEAPAGEELPTVDVSLQRPALETSTSGPLVAAVAAAGRDRGLRALELQGVGYWTDAAIFAECSSEVLLFGPSGARAHESEEWVSFESVVKTARVLSAAARSYCG